MTENLNQTNLQYRTVQAVNANVNTLNPNVPLMPQQVPMQYHMMTQPMVSNAVNAHPVMYPVHQQMNTVPMVSYQRVPHPPQHMHAQQQMNSAQILQQNQIHHRQTARSNRHTQSTHSSSSIAQSTDRRRHQSRGREHSHRPRYYSRSRSRSRSRSPSNEHIQTRQTVNENDCGNCTRLEHEILTLREELRSARQQLDESRKQLDSSRAEHDAVFRQMVALQSTCLLSMESKQQEADDGEDSSSSDSVMSTTSNANSTSSNTQHRHKSHKHKSGKTGKSKKNKSSKSKKNKANNNTLKPFKELPPVIQKRLKANWNNGKLKWTYDKKTISFDASEWSHDSFISSQTLKRKFEITGVLRFCLLSGIGIIQTRSSDVSIGLPTTISGLTKWITMNGRGNKLYFKAVESILGGDVYDKLSNKQGKLTEDEIKKCKEDLIDFKTVAKFDCDFDPARFNNRNPEIQEHESQDAPSQAAVVPKPKDDK